MRAHACKSPATTRTRHSHAYALRLRALHQQACDTEQHTKQRARRHTHRKQPPPTAGHEVEVAAQVGLPAPPGLDAAAGIGACRWVDGWVDGLWGSILAARAAAREGAGGAGPPLTPSQAQPKTGPKRLPLAHAPAAPPVEGGAHKPGAEGQRLLGAGRGRVQGVGRRRRPQHARVRAYPVGGWGVAKCPHTSRTACASLRAMTTLPVESRRPRMGRHSQHACPPKQQRARGSAAAGRA